MSYRRFMRRRVASQPDCMDRWNWGAEVGEPGRPTAEILHHGAGLQTAQPQTHLSCRLRHRLQQVDEAAAVLEVLTPGGDLNAGKDHLPVALPPQLLRLAHRLLQR